MNTSKIIKGVVSNGRYTVTAPIVKEDYGLYLQIEGVELPSTYEVDFSNSENSGTSVTMIGNADGVLIPRQFIETGKDIFAFLYHVGADYGRTVFKFRIPNKLRPDRTNEQPTPEEQSTIDQAISALNEAVAQTAQDVIDADASAQSAQGYAEQAETARDTAQGYAEQAQTSATQASASASQASASALASAQSAQSASQSAQTASAKADSITGLTAQATTLPDGSSASASYNPETGVMSFGIPKGKDGTNGTDGDDGYSPTASVSKSGKVATITITDQNGTTSAQVEDGTDGTDGISPTVTITPIAGGHRITITDADGEHSADVMDGTGDVDDVQINGTSIVSDGVANVPIASNAALGVSKATDTYGITMRSDGNLQIYSARPSEIKSGNNNTRPIVPANQSNATFYGLAKASGDSTQSSSSNAVGTYTEEAKVAIQKMLGINQQGELIADITATEDVTEFLVTTDINGLAFALTKMVVIFTAGVPTTGARDAFYIQATFENRQNNTFNSSCPSLTYPTATSGMIARLTIDVFDGIPLIPTAIVAAGDGNTQNVVSMVKPFIAKTIKGIKIYQSGATKSLIPAGSNIKVYGIRA